MEKKQGAERGGRRGYPCPGWGEEREGGIPCPGLGGLIPVEKITFPHPTDTGSNNGRFFLAVGSGSAETSVHFTCPYRLIQKYITFEIRHHLLRTGKNFLRASKFNSDRKLAMQYFIRTLAHGNYLRVVLLANINIGKL